MTKRIFSKIESYKAVYIKIKNTLNNKNHQEHIGHTLRKSKASTVKISTVQMKKLEEKSTFIKKHKCIEIDI